MHKKASKMVEETVFCPYNMGKDVPGNSFYIEKITEYFTKGTL